MAKTYWHFNESDRRRIERLLDSGESGRSIARKLGRSPNSINLEIKRNRVKGVYLARKSEHKARVRRRASKVQSLRVLKRKTRDFVEKKIRLGWSPELVSGRLREVLGKDAPSIKAIYKFVYSIYGRKIERFLPSKQWKKKAGPKRKRFVCLDGRKMIAERPAVVEKRKQFGHFEMDFIESGRDGTGSLLVLVERMSRYPFLVYTESRKTEHINTMVAETLRDIPILSITTDNDISFQKHEELSKLVGADIFFCNPYHSWEKGTIENRNRAVRKWLAKGTDLSEVSRAKIMAVEHQMRHRPMKCLGYLTPFEMWQREMERIQQKKHRVAPSGMMVEKLLINDKVSYFRG